MDQDFLNQAGQGEDDEGVGEGRLCFHAQWIELVKQHHDQSQQGAEAQRNPEPFSRRDSFGPHGGEAGPAGERKPCPTQQRRGDHNEPRHLLPLIDREGQDRFHDEQYQHDQHKPDVRRAG